MKVFICTFLSLITLLSGCAELRGIPQGLSADQTRSLGTGSLDNNLTVATELGSTWEGKRNSAYNYVFWSNAALIPLAVGGAVGAAFKGSKDLLTGIGIGAGAVIGTNTFVGAGAIGAAYQSGINGLSCISAGLAPYTASGSKSADAQRLGVDVLALEAQIATASTTLGQSMGLDLTSPQAMAERLANPSIVSTLANNEKALAQAISDSQAAAVGGHAELHLYATLGTYSRDRILDVNRIVEAKIKPSTVNYASLAASLLPAPIAPKTQTPTTSTIAPAPPVHGAPAPATPIADAANATKRAADNLAGPTKKVTTETTDFDLTAQESSISSCIKSL